MDIKATARGKLLLFGEHSAVYGYPAVGITLDKELCLKMSPKKGSSFMVQDPDPSLISPTKTFIRSFANPPFSLLQGYDLSISSSIPPGGGFGSSGALCGALARGLKQIGARQDVWPLAHEMEKYFHGTPSGIDTALALGEGVTAFYGSLGTLPRAKVLKGFPFTLVYGSIPRDRSTKELVGMVRSKREREGDKIIPLLDKLGALAEEGIRLFQKSSGGSFGPLASKAQELLAALGLSTPLLDGIMDLAQKNGALGGKLSGAGGGGAFFLVVPNRDTGFLIIQKLKALYGREGFSGVAEILEYDPR